ncbi:hypothetical protein QE152_g33440 [Popillia japonica]|uniref:Uncharacterized protein n=1 Tax=Popillia japonica TaxID=7064 RepID=A0AAW1IWN5_POPJA
MQLLDRGFFAPLKTAFSSECDKWIVTNQGRPITQKQMSALFHAAYSKVATIQICEKSFTVTGLYPYNPDVFNEDDFAPAEVTNIPPPVKAVSYKIKTRVIVVLDTFIYFINMEYTLFCENVSMGFTSFQNKVD